MLIFPSRQATAPASRFLVWYTLAVMAQVICHRGLSLFSRRARHLVVVILALFLAACASPATRYAQRAAELGFHTGALRAGDFTLTLYRHPGLAACRQLHVYLDGDGAPWLSRNQVSGDPTPRGDLLLRLMAADPAPSVYLGRPCHHGHASEPPCRPWLWTHGRYSETVVDSLAGAIGQLRRDSPRTPVILIGHSGGGTLAQLLATRVDVDAVITLAGSLDVAAWTRLHGYSPLQGLDPARLPPPPAQVRQLHLAGAEDDNVPPSLTRAALASSPGAELRILPGTGHLGPWERSWPELIGAFCAESGSAPPR